MDAVRHLPGGGGQGKGWGGRENISMKCAVRPCTLLRSSCFLNSRKHRATGYAFSNCPCASLDFMGPRRRDWYLRISPSPALRTTGGILIHLSVFASKERSAVRKVAITLDPIHVSVRV